MLSNVLAIAKRQMCQYSSESKLANASVDKKIHNVLLEVIESSHDQFSISETIDALSILIKMLPFQKKTFFTSLRSIYLLLSNSKANDILDLSVLESFDGLDSISPYSLKPYQNKFVFGLEVHSMLFILIFYLLQKMDDYKNSHFHNAELVLLLRVLLVIPNLSFQEKSIFLVQCLPGIISSISFFFQKKIISCIPSEISILSFKVFETWIFNTLSDAALKLCKDTMAIKCLTNNEIKSSFIRSLPNVISRDEPWYETCQRKILPIIAGLSSFLNSLSYTDNYLLQSLLTLVISCPSLLLPINRQLLIKVCRLFEYSTDKYYHVITAPIKVFFRELEDLSIEYFKRVTLLISENLTEYNSQRFRDDLYILCGSLNKIHITSKFSYEILDFLKNNFFLFIADGDSVSICLKLSKLYTFQGLGFIVKSLFSICCKNIHSLGENYQIPLFIFLLAVNNAKATMINESFNFIPKHFDKHFDLSDISNDEAVFSLDVFQTNQTSLKIPISFSRQESELLSIKSTVGTCISSWINNDLNIILSSLEVINSTEAVILNQSSLLFSLIPKLLMFYDGSVFRKSEYKKKLSTISSSILGKLAYDKNFPNSTDGIARYLSENSQYILNALYSDESSIFDGEDANKNIISNTELSVMERNLNESKDKIRAVLQITAILKPLFLSKKCIFEILLPNVPLIDKILSILEDHQDNLQIVSEFLNMFFSWSRSFIQNPNFSKSHYKSHESILFSTETVNNLKSLTLELEQSFFEKNISSSSANDFTEKETNSNTDSLVESFILITLPVLSHFLCHDSSNIRIIAFRIISNYFKFFPIKDPSISIETIGSTFELPYAKKLFPLLHSNIWPPLVTALKHINDPILFTAALDALDAIAASCFSFVKERMNSILGNLIKNLSLAIKKIESKGIPTISNKTERQKLLTSTISNTYLGLHPYNDTRYLELVSYLLEKLSTLLTNLNYDDRNTLLLVLQCLNSSIFNEPLHLRQTPNLQKNQQALKRTIKCISPHLYYFSSLDKNMGSSQITV